MTLRPAVVGSSDGLLRLMVILILGLVMSVSATADDTPEIRFDIAPQPLRQALLEFSEQARIQLILAADTEDIPASRGVTGTMTAEEALVRLTLGTGLEYHFSSGNTVTVRRQKVKPEPPLRPEKPAGQQDIDQLSIAPASFEEIISIGTRVRGRTVGATSVPVDVLSPTALASTGQAETGRMLQMLVPSFNFSSSSVSDGTDALRPATLRGMSPDQTLVLLNGRRRHASALVHVNTSVGRGSAGTDMNAVPAIALGRIEVLRDGAAAQYGSDAIAGVINLALRRDREGGRISVSRGATYAGDGDTTTVNGFIAYPVSSRGFVNLSLEYRDRAPTNRAGLSANQQYFGANGESDCAATPDPASCYDPREYTFDRRNFRIGDAASEQFAAVFNAEIPFGDVGHWYGFATYSDRDNMSAGFYRRVTQPERTVASLYPDGFLPLINTEITDVSAASGLVLKSLAGWHVDLGFAHGRNEFAYRIKNSLNASLGADSPFEADAGSLLFSQSVLSLDAVREGSLGGRDVTLAMGAEYRRDRYEIRAGEHASYSDGGLNNTNCPGCDVAPVRYQQGFQVFRGFSPDNAVDRKRDSFALYSDLDLSVTAVWRLSAAARFEHYDDFGSRLTGKMTSRVKLTEGLALRGALSTGFRAPSVQQKYFNSVSTQFVDAGGLTVAQERGTFRNDSALAVAIGVPQLKEETAINVSAGLVWTLPNFTLTADYYHIDIEDRIAISGSVDIARLFPDVSSRMGITNGQFFFNAADTVTKGADIVAVYDWPLSGDDSLEFSLAANWNSTVVKDGSIRTTIGDTLAVPLFTPQDISILQDWQPESRVMLAATYETGPVSLLLRANRFGGYRICEGTCDQLSGDGRNVQAFGAEWVLDAQVSYEFERHGVTATIGANNILGQYPDRNLIGQAGAGDLPGILSSEGVFTYSRRAAPFGFNGGYWYARLSFSF
ncbi:TonB-dependent receptor domain-containing protein [Kordiimonas lipolytica]|uniref:TonB-dependent receptor domain-containing protein n=1 Tax=Kordiimonas lipolytica TaxID=1662421 RepID=A0ABV8U975_9PROT|nr:TonB-dependent receptor [Kordiimonas lipolytica]